MYRGASTSARWRLCAGGRPYRSRGPEEPRLGAFRRSAGSLRLCRFVLLAEPQRAQVTTDEAAQELDIGRELILELAAQLRLQRLALVLAAHQRALADAAEVARGPRLPEDARQQLARDEAAD